MNGEALVLSGNDGEDPPFPVREGCRVTPLIESAEMYPLLEREMLAAERSIWFAFRIFDPTMKVRSDEAGAAGLETWLDLIEDRVRNGIQVRVLLSDFEPVMADGLHAGSWSSFHSLADRMSTLEDVPDERFQMAVVLHEGEVGWGWRQLLRPALHWRIRKLVTGLIGGDEDDAGGDAMASRPGLWRYLHWDGEQPHRWKRGPLPRLWPATYHHKFAIIDGCKAIIGGLDLNERRWDDANHEQRADATWHDVSSLVEGPAVGDAARHFARLWNRELPRYRATVEEWTLGSARSFALKPLIEIEPPALPRALPDGAACVQLARTLSRRSGRVFAFGPAPHIRELREAYRRLFASARERLYIETQFFRSSDATDWLISALEANPELEIIILVANVPEEIAFLGQGGNPAHQHGEFLQARSLTRILATGGLDRVGLFTLAKQEPIRFSERRFARRRGTAYGSGLIHIHAKLVIADDHACLLSSANINGRSFEWDTELGYIWSRDPGIAKFRHNLWSQLFSDELGGGATLADWRTIAEHNRTAEPDARKGFVVPYQRTRARRFGNPYRWVPDRFV